VPTPSFYQQHFGFAWACLRRLGVPPADLEDVTHDVFLVVHRRRAELARATSPRGWLFGIVRRVASNYRRGVWRHHRRLALAHEAEPRTNGLDPDIEHTDAAHMMSRFLDGLDLRQREIFVLFELQQLTAREVAEILAINPNTASARLRAVRKAFDGFAARVRAENGFDLQVVVARTRADDRPDREAERRVSAALALSLPANALELAATGHGLAMWATSMVTAVVLGGALRIASGPTSNERLLGPVADEVGRNEARSASKAMQPQHVAPALPSQAAPAVSTTTPGTEFEPTDVVAARNHPSSPSLRRAEGPSDVPDTPKTIVDDLAVQNDLLARARAALEHGNTHTATRIVADYRERFPVGAFLAEVDLIDIRARCAARDVVTARRRARQFVLTHVGSPHVAIIDRTCAGPITKIPAGGD